MATLTPLAQSIRSFKSESAFEAWLMANHAKESEVFLRIYKKDSCVPTVTHLQALDVALCYGWIDGIRKPYDDRSFLQRFTPRKPKSRWSQINRDNVARLCAAGRMTPHGQKQVDAAKADGRWDAAYASQRQIEIPPDLMAAIEAEPKALRTFEHLSPQNIYSLAYRTLHLKTAEARTRRIKEFVAMLKRGESIHPNNPGKAAGSRASHAKTKRRPSTPSKRPIKPKAPTGNKARSSR